MVGRSDYHERKEERIERYRDRAEKNRKEADSRHDAARAIGSAIPFGQPILVGHHSEKRHRRDIEKIDTNMRKSVEASKKAAHYEDRAASAESNHAISSDNPDAIELLKERLAELEAEHAEAKAVNRAYKKFLKDPASLETAGLSEYWTAYIRLFKPEWSGDRPCPSYSLSNRNANMKRIRDRIKSLETLEELEDVEIEYDGFKLVEDTDDNRVKLIFPGKPSTEIRKLLKSRGFRWSDRAGAWQRLLNANGRHAAREVAKLIDENHNT